LITEKSEIFGVENKPSWNAPNCRFFRCRFYVVFLNRNLKSFEKKPRFLRHN